MKYYRQERIGLTIGGGAARQPELGGVGRLHARLCRPRLVRRTYHPSFEQRATTLRAKSHIGVPSPSNGVAMPGLIYQAREGGAREGETEFLAGAHRPQEKQEMNARREEQPAAYGAGILSTQQNIYVDTSSDVRRDQASIFLRLS